MENISLPSKIIYCLIYNNQYKRCNSTNKKWNHPRCNKNVYIFLGKLRLKAFKGQFYNYQQNNEKPLQTLFMMFVQQILRVQYRVINSEPAFMY